MARVNSIVDLPFDCLVSIFKYLEVEDLVNLYEADISDRRKLSNCEPDYESEMNHFDQSIIYAFTIVANVRKCPTTISMDLLSARKQIKMLRIFGRKVRAIRITYTRDHVDGSYIKELEDAICKHCWKTVSSYHISHCTSDFMKELDKPFENAKVVAFYNSDIRGRFKKLDKWFPRMHALKLYDCNVEATCIHTHFPQMKSFEVWNGNKYGPGIEKGFFTNCDLKIFFLLNPQLKHLHISHDNVGESLSGSDAILVDHNLLTFISENLKLETLTLNLLFFRLQRQWESAVPMEGLHSVVVECANCRNLATIQIKSLDRLILKVDLMHGPLNYGTLAAFVKCAEPKRLEIIANHNRFNRNFLDIDKLQFVGVLPQLVELVIECSFDYPKMDAVITLLTKCDTLERMTVIFIDDCCIGDGPSIQYLMMRPTFSDNFTQCNELAQKWTIKFEYTNDRICEQYRIDLHKIQI